MACPATEVLGELFCYIVAVRFVREGGGLSYSTLLNI